MLQALRQFIRSTDFVKALVITFGAAAPVLLGLWLGQVTYFLSMAIGVVLASGSDVPGSQKHKTVGILVSAAIAMLASMAIGLASGSLYLLLPVLAVLVFAISFVSVYGFRASLVSFAGLMAIVLSFVRVHTGVDILIHGLLIGTGGLWALLLSLLFHRLLQRRQTENLLIDCLQQTARYLKLRGKLAMERQDAEALQNELYNLQVKLNEIHEALREVLLSERQNLGTSNYHRRQLLIFIELIDILELSLANPANYERAKELFQDADRVLQPFIQLVFELSDKLGALAESMQLGTALSAGKDLEPLLEKCYDRIRQYVEELKLPQAREGALLLHNLLDYEEKQLEKIQAIERVYQDLEEQQSIGLQSRESQRFITQQDYDAHTLKENFTPESPIFKHAARVTIAMLLGYGLGILFPIQNAYWILLTIVVIMRPGYTLTKERAKHRLYGTLIGAAVAAVVVLSVRNVYLYGALAMVSLVLSFAFIQKNYRTSSVFVTTGVIFIYALITPNAFDVIQYRVIDTLTGAAIAMGAIYFLWPSWESLTIKGHIVKALSANRNYLAEIDRYNQHKTPNTTAYKLARKEAFLQMGNLNAAFQRMSQEPKSRQQHPMRIYKIVGLNHTFLAAAAALGTFIRDNNAEAASEHFDLIIKSIDANLAQALQTLQQDAQAEEVTREELVEAYGQLEGRYSELVAIRTRQLDGATYKPIEPGFLKNLKEARLISDQLKWLHTISGNLKQAVKELA
ncbi:FUSC family protein [Pontibacter sp. JH31]|uniref:FUSC family protein n=1 Tax=Pontibacter aquaedesilientis TaxID=2766980 RepID=A0ABR7XCD0_9BACT|nr:FUSC family membrane protein [Pontibacter aquaedesilientis]MBD1395954.1 FUSC family protein [Pontibacter aquaedesilientis]